MRNALTRHVGVAVSRGRYRGCRHPWRWRRPMLISSRTASAGTTSLAKPRRRHADIHQTTSTTDPALFTSSVCVMRHLAAALCRQSSTCATLSWPVDVDAHIATDQEVSCWRRQKSMTTCYSRSTCDVTADVTWSDNGGLSNVSWLRVSSALRQRQMKSRDRLGWSWLVLSSCPRRERYAAALRRARLSL